MKRVITGLTAAGIALLAVGCGSSGGSGSGGSADPQVTLRLGYLENITHATALVGEKQGFFTKNLGHNVTVKFLDRKAHV